MKHNTQQDSVDPWNQDHIIELISKIERQISSGKKIYLTAKDAEILCERNRTLLYMEYMLQELHAIERAKK